MAQSWTYPIEKEISAISEDMKTWSGDEYPELRKTIDSILSSSDRVTSALCILSYFISGGRDSMQATHIASCFETVYDGLHLHDKIDLDGKVKGYKKKLFSKDPTTTKAVVAGDYMFVNGFRLAYSNAPGVVPYLMKVSAIISDGILGIVNSTDNPDFTEDDCMEILKKKYVSEIQVSMECAAKEAGADDSMVKAMSDIGFNIGMAYNVMQDVIDLIGRKIEPPTMIKIRYGEPSYPIYLALNDPVSKEMARECFGNRKITAKEELSLVHEVRKSGMLAKCSKFVEGYKEKARELIKALPESEYSKALSECIDSIQVVS
jgi:geranylgeranyl pyrophosphate synthase